MTLSSAGLSDQEGGCRKYGGLDELRQWIANINEKHIGDEKHFVDLVVARNPDAIDLEMALPAYSLVPEERIAPRMDLVALEPVGNRWRIVFWEAKLVDDARARSGATTFLPKSLINSRNTQAGYVTPITANWSLVLTRTPAACWWRSADWRRA